MKDFSWYGIFPGNTLWAVAFCLLVFPLVWVIPPFQSPDEFGHFCYANAFFSEQNHIDEGLRDLSVLTEPLKFHYKKKYTRELLQKSKELRFTGTMVQGPDLYYFTDYLPVVYFPQRLASIFARRIGSQPYELLLVCKIVNICCISAIFCVGLWRGGTTPLAILIMFLPMVLFQSASLSSDGMNVALTFLSAVIYAKSMRESFISPADQILLFLSLVCLICHRIHMFPLVFVPIFIYYKYQDKKLLIMCIALVAIFFIWIVYTSLAKPIYQTGISINDAALYYITHPVMTLNILSNTFSDTFISLKLKQFIGILGWLDAPLAPLSYKIIYFFYGIIALCTINIKKSVLTLSSIFLVLGPILCMFFIALCAFTKFPAQTILGIQGRYFILPAIYAGVTLFNSDRVTKYKYGMLFIIIICMTSIIITSSSVVYCLLNRYYI